MQGVYGGGNLHFVEGAWYVTMRPWRKRLDDLFWPVTGPLDGLLGMVWWLQEAHERIHGMKEIPRETGQALREVCTREQVAVWFGELDVRRAETRGLEYYVERIASPKLHYLAFAAALLRCDACWREDGFAWVRSLPEFLRGALIWWMRVPQFSALVFHRQKRQGYWPFVQEEQQGTHHV